MAKISSPWVGISSGKLGEGVYYHRSGRQCARARNRQPANPKSAAQSMQRMVLATTAKLTKALEPIVNHSWEGKSVGLTSVNYFRSLAMKAFRAAAIDGLSDDSTIKADFCLKGSPTIGVCENIPVSRGSLGALPILEVGGVGYLDIVGDTTDTWNTTITTQAQYEAALLGLNCEPGDQLTFIVFGTNYNNVVASFGNENDYESIIRYSRVTFVKEIASGINAKLFTEEGVINSVFIESSEGKIPKGEQFAIGIEWYMYEMLPIGFDLIAATAIRSKKLESGTKFSSAKLFINVTSLNENNCRQTYPSYMNGAESIQVGTQLYLRNAVEN